MYWLAEQGLAPKSVFLIIIPLIIFITTQIRKNDLKGKEDRSMRNKPNIIDVVRILLNIIENLSGNIAGGALLANAL